MNKTTLDIAYPNRSRVAGYLIQSEGFLFLKIGCSRAAEYYTHFF